MSDAGPQGLIPFAPQYRASGVLVHITSQDLLNLGAEARMNLPGSPQGNWRWRCTDEMLSESLVDRLRGLNTSSNRSS